MSESTEDPPPSVTTENPPLSTWEKHHFWKFVILIVSLWCLCFVLVLIPRIIVYLCHRPQKRTTGKSSRTDQVLVEPSFYSSVQNWAEDLISGNTTSGRILVVFAFVCSMVAFVLYIHGKQISLARWG